MSTSDAIGANSNSDRGTISSVSSITDEKPTLEVMKGFASKIAEINAEMDPKKGADAFVRRLMLDKMYLGNRSVGGFTQLCQFNMALAELIQNQNDWPLDDESKRCLKELDQHFFPMLRDYERVCVAAYEKIIDRSDLLRGNDQEAIIDQARLMHRLLLKEALVTKLHTMVVGDREIVVIDSKIHCFNMMIKKTSESTFDIIIYNTGEGLSRFHKYLSRNSIGLYQTYYEISDIPADSILNSETWEQYPFLYKHTVNEIYAWVTNVLGQGGVKEVISDDGEGIDEISEKKSEEIFEETYERSQESLSCAVQVWMTQLRHEIMTIASGTMEEREACYKVIKTYLFLQYLEDHIEDIPSETFRYLKFVSNKLHAEEGLMALALDEEKTRQTLEGEEALPEGANFQTRYARLRKLSKKLFDEKLVQRGQVPSHLNTTVVNSATVRKTKYQVALEVIEALISESEQDQVSEYFGGKRNQIKKRLDMNF